MARRSGVATLFGKKIPPTPAIPANTALPVISGSPNVGATLTCSTGTWTGYPPPTYAYAWKKDGVANGSTGPTYVPVSGDIGGVITCTVSATNSQGGPISATSAGTAAISAALAAPVNTVAPAVTGSTSIGAVLTSTQGTWTGNPTPTYGYQWTRDGVNISGATTSTYTLVTSDAGKAIVCVVTATNSQAAVSQASNSTSVPALTLPVNTVAPAVTGTATVGSVLSSTTGTWTGNPASFTYGYQWFWADAVTPISGATSSTYTLVSGDTGHTVLCNVTATNTTGSTSQASNTTAAITSASSAALDLPFSTMSAGSDLTAKGVTFTRSGNAMMYDSTGKLTWAPNNLYTTSEDVSGVQWANGGTGSTRGTRTFSFGADGDSRVYQNMTATRDGSFIISAQFSAADVGKQIRFSVWATGVDGLANGRSSDITVPADGRVYYKFSNLTGMSIAGFCNSSAGAAQTFTLATVGGFQCEQVTYQTTPRAYIATTSAAVYGPRFDYDPSTLAAKGLLIEESRSNVIAASPTAFYCTTTANAAISPTGVNDANRFVEDTSTPAGGDTHEFFQGTYSVSAGAVWTHSVFLKAGARTKARVMAVIGGVAAGYYVDADLSAGTIGSATAIGAATATGASIANVGNGWYRVSVSGSMTSGSNLYTVVQLLNASGTPAYTGDGSSDLYQFGTQFELGAFATSYIPTTSASVTRAAETASMTGTNFSSWYNQSEGTFVVEADVEGLQSNPGVYRATNTADDSYHQIYMGSGGTTLRTVVNPSQQASFSLTAATANVFQKLAYAYKLNDFNAALNGVASTTYTSGTVPSDLNRLFIADLTTGGAQLNGHLKSLKYFNTRKTNAELVSLST